MKHIKFVDQVRGFAILAVFLYHSVGSAFGTYQLGWSGWIRNFDAPYSFLVLWPITFGWVGVSVFFVVSGFCIHISYERSREKSIVKFYVRRFFRIYPPYLAALLIFSFVYPWHYIQFDAEYGYEKFVSHLFLVHNFDGRSFFEIVPAFWSIAVEFQLYLLYPVLLLIVGRYAWTKTLWIVGCVEVGMRICDGIFSTIYDIPLPSWLFTGSPFCFWFSWAVGAAIADAVLNHRPIPFQDVPIFIFPSLVIVTAIFKPLASLSFMFAALSTASLFGLLLSKEGRAHAMDSSATIAAAVKNHLSFVGLISYSVYLLHHPILLLVPHAMGVLFPDRDLHPATILLVCLVMWFPVLLLSWCFFRVLEVPSIEIGKKLIRLGTKVDIDRKR